jgi:WD40 repeat protein
MKRGFSGETPTTTIETDVCITALEFHPTKPSWLIGGSFNGEIFLWDLAREDAAAEQLLAKSSVDEYFHRECVSQFLWLELKVQGSAAVQQVCIFFFFDSFSVLAVEIIHF